MAEYYINFKNYIQYRVLDAAVRERGIKTKETIKNQRSQVVVHADDTVIMARRE